MVNAVTNRLLAPLPRLDQKQMIAKCERVQLTVGESLYESGEPIRFVYFPTGGFASLLASTDRASRVEVALIGSEGMLGMSCMLEVAAAPLKVLVQGAGSAWRMEMSEFLRQIETRPALSSRLARYLYVRMLDLAQMVTCTRFHLVEPRLARWLLMMRDRAHSDHFVVTHTVMARMLGHDCGRIAAEARTHQLPARQDSDSRWSRTGAYRMQLLRPRPGIVRAPHGLSSRALPYRCGVAHVLN
jgi:CRP-like cAMP-binding protein